MDKNKSAFKLKGFGPLYVINLDGQDRIGGNGWRSNLSTGSWILPVFLLTTAERTSLSDIIRGRYPEMMTSGGGVVVASHLGTIGRVV